jgi:glycosyltransferase involved in cell wall biosynthesis
MKILFALHGFPPEVTGGTERTVEALAQAMVAAGHEVTILCGSLGVGPTDRVDELDHQGLRILRLHRDDLYFESWWKCYHPGVSATIAEVLAQVAPDVVHVHHWLRLSSDIVRLARAAGAKTVVTMHDYYPVLAQVVRRHDDEGIAAPAESSWMTSAEAAEDFALHRRDFEAEIAAAHLVLAPSQAHADGVQTLAGADFGAIGVTAPPMLDLPQRLAVDPKPAGSRLLTWGSLYPDKGLETLLDAMRAADGDWSLRVMGDAHDPEYRRELMNFAAGLEIEFTGSFETADLSTAEADYAVLPTLCLESYGLVVDEAQALGLPMIMSDVPAYREHSQEASTAFFPPGDAATLTMMLLDPAALVSLQRPTPPAVPNAAEAAADLLGRYEGLDTSPPYVPDLAVERARARALFRRAERRLWSALNAPGDQVPLPPDEFLQ